MPSEPILVRNYDRVLMDEAERALSRGETAEAEGDSRTAGGGYFTTIVAATGATEYWLSEILAHLEDVRWIGADERVRIRGKRGLWSKLNELMKVWHVWGFHTRPIYEDYRALVSLRNVVVHRSAEFLEPGEWPDEIQPFRSRIDHVEKDGLDWTSQVLSAPTARWAVATARDLLKQCKREIPDPGQLSSAERRE